MIDCKALGRNNAALVHVDAANALSTNACLGVLVQ